MEGQGKSKGIEAVQLVAGISDHPPLFLVPAGLGLLTNVISYQDLIHRLGNKGSVYGLVTCLNEGNDLPFTTMDELVRAEVHALRTVRPHGPYSLVGICAGGRVAYEVARALVQDGEKVGLLLFLDTPLRPSIRRSVQNPLVENLLLAWYRVQQLHKSFNYHKAHLVHAGWGERAHYIGVRFEARLPSSLHTRSNALRLLLTSKQYYRLIRDFEPTQPYPHPITAIVTRERYESQPSWDAIAPEAEMVFVEGAHSNYLQVSADKVVSIVRESLEAAHGASTYKVK
jgi:thioesterase domain-containing protein